ncbi:uncharacterized protein [Diadema antillarum]|uniref:uncharacterized protein n=1 Tax=Diadema antillarum TaxID=105358 RepID=UPI003A86A49B
MAATERDTAVPVDETLERMAEVQEERNRQPTERGIQWNLDVRRRGFRSSLTKWRRSCSKLRTLLLEDDYDEIKQHRNTLQDCMDKLIDAQEQYSAICTEDNDILAQFDEVEADHASVMKETFNILKNLRCDTSSMHSDAPHERSRYETVQDVQMKTSAQVVRDDVTPLTPETKETPLLEMELTRNLQDTLHLHRLPLPEPPVFNGKPLNYPAWKMSYNLLIEHSKVPPHERFFYLLKYLRDEPREMVEGYALAGDDMAYRDAIKSLDERYGNTFVISNAFRDRLDSWPKIAPKDSAGLRRLSDFLRQCHTASKTVHHLNHLDDERENRKITSKLPDWLITRWGRTVVQWRKETGAFPPFAVFVKFVEDEAAIACDPVVSFGSLRDDKLSHGKQSKARSMNTMTQAQSANTEGRKSPTCSFCGAAHHTDKCQSFAKLDLQARKEFILKNGLCYGCLQRGHMSRSCRRRLRCANCKGQHPTLLHGDTRQTLSTESTKTETRVGPDKTTSNRTEHRSTSSCSRSDHSHISSSMIVPVWLSHRNDAGERLTYALLDTQSDTTFLLKSIKDEMGIHGTEVNLQLSTLSMKNQRITSERVEGLCVRAHDGKNKIALPPTYTRDIMPADRSHVPTPKTAKSIPHLCNLSSKLMPLQDCDIGLLIGYDCARALMPRDVIPAPCNNGPYGIRTDLGWSIVGTMRPNYICEDDDHIGTSHRLMAREIPDNLVIDRKEVFLSEKTTTREQITPHQVRSLMEADFSDVNDEGTVLSQNDYKFLDILEKGIHKSSDGHYEMPLPFKDERPQLPNNKAQARSRLIQLERRFRHNMEYHKKYTEVMETLISKGYAESVPVGNDESTTWYIPHHGVIQPNKLRVVFDCSAQYRGHSLNSHLLTGPDLTNKLTGVLCRFRRENVAFICDIKEMFHQFKVNEEDRDYLRFLWWKGGNLDEDPSTYRMKVHLFGAGSSPGCANFGLRRLATDLTQEFGEDVKNFIHHDFYVDDGLQSMLTAQEVIQLITKTKLLCEKGGLHLHKFVSNNREVLNAVPEEDRAKNVREINLQHDDLPIERALGVQWCVESDTFNFRMTLQDKPLTRRGVLSTVMSIYDPLGLIAPLILPGKRILQELCSLSVDWDDPLSEELRTRWERWRSDLLTLPTVSINRCYKPADFGEVKFSEYHHFADASTSGYGQCTYLRVANPEGQVHCSLVIGKARVAPLKMVTIPRLELTAAVVAVKVKAFLDTELQLEGATHTFWTDSKVVLGYINNDEKRFHVFVANRVHQIRRHSSTSQWRHIESRENPADDASRGLTVAQLKDSKWLRGPDFLWKSTLPAQSTGEKFMVHTDDPELKKSHVHTSHVSPSFLHSSRLDRFSTWHKAKRAVANCMLFIARLRQRCEEKRNKNHNKRSEEEAINVERLKIAEIEIVRLVQRETFPEEIQALSVISRGDDLTMRQKTRQMKMTSRLRQLDPFLDDRGILRVGGRIRKCDEPYEKKHPVILPRQHHVTELVIRHCHEQTAHQGRGTTLNQVRQSGYWILGGSGRVSKYIRSCVTCKRLRGPALTQKMSDLPPDRITPAPPFTYCGMDCFGPWMIKEGRKELKRYGLLFTCMASRAVHIETLNDMSTDAFIQAYRRFVSIRGPVRQLRCDRGTNFVGAASEFQRAGSEMDRTKVKDVLLRDGCDFVEFKFNVPSASHMGGAWERLIRSVRTVLDGLLNHAGSQLDDESLRTLMHEAAAIVNSRPLTIDDLSDPAHPAPLTPNQLITMKTSVILPPPGCFQRADVYSRKRWRRVQHLLNEFWSRWRKEFLHNLQTRQKWTVPQRDLGVGDVVVVKDDNAPRNAWPMGRIAETYPSGDNHVRKVKVAMGEQNLNGLGRRTTPCSYLDRPVHKLVLLVPQEDQE